jgi:hypothetical protein
MSRASHARREDCHLSSCKRRKISQGRLNRQAETVIQLILIAALRRKTRVLRSGEAANSTAIYQFRIGLQHCGMMADIADWR